MTTWKLGLDSDSYNFQVDVWRCPQQSDKLQSEIRSRVSDPPSAQHITTTHPPLIKNVLGENLYATLHSLLSDKPLQEPPVLFPEVPTISEGPKDSSCESIFQLTISAYSLIILSYIVFALSLIAVISLVIYYLRTWSLKRNRKSEKVSSDYEVNSEKGSEKSVDKEEEENVTAEEATVCDSLISSVRKASLRSSQNTDLNTGIPLAYQPRLYVGSQSEIDVIEFLNTTTEKLFAKLDRLLLQQSTENQCQNHVSFATPRLARRSLNRRQRIDSSPSLPQFDSTNHQGEGHDNEKTVLWNNFKRFSKHFGWIEPVLMKVDDTKYDRKVQRLLHYYQRVCPMISDHWATATMIVNYTILILQSNLEQIIGSCGYRFLRFAPTGSGQIGSKVGKPNQFDIYMVLQPPVVPRFVIEETSEESIPPGQMLIVAELPMDTSVPVREVVSQIKVNSHYKGCLSARMFARSAEELIDMCLQTLYTKSRSLMDRLPFQIKKAPTANLVLSIDTKALVGLNTPDIKVNLHPVLPLHIDGWYQTCNIYATATLNDEEVTKYRPNTSHNAVSPDFLWHSNLGDVNKIYLENVDLKMLHAGVTSCHSVCLMVLKALLTRGNKSSLLDRGMFASQHISTVLNFLLLESTPQQWQMDQLSNRFSDTVHFLRAAFKNHRLPDFFINNPCLSKKMPFVKGNKFLQRPRQKNILADMRPEGFEKCLEYLEDCLRETGLQECVAKEYSDDMWEYEFFVY